MEGGWRSGPLERKLNTFALYVEELEGGDVMVEMSAFLKSTYVEALIPKWDGILRWSHEKVIAVR